MSGSYKPVDFTDLPGWLDDDLEEAFSSFLQTAHFHLNVKPYSKKSFDIDARSFNAACYAALVLSQRPDLTTKERRKFFENHFNPFKVEENGFVTGYYEPEIDVSFSPDERYKYPFYRKPDDLISVNERSHLPQAIDKKISFVQKQGGHFRVYPDRRAIDQGYLKGRKLEIAYAASKADVYFAHIQGSARLRGKNGETMRISYAAKSGHPYTSIGKILVDRGEILNDEMSMEAIRAWMKRNPSRIDDIIWQNQSFIFFEECVGQVDELGPKGASKIQLISGRSLAIDRQIYSFGLPVFVASPSYDILNEGKLFARLMICQDTGSAITGLARGDIFVGSGNDAGKCAGNIAHKVSFYMFAPKTM